MKIVFMSKYVLAVSCASLWQRCQRVVEQEKTKTPNLVVEVICPIEIDDIEEKELTIGRIEFIPEPHHTRITESPLLRREVGYDTAEFVNFPVRAPEPFETNWKFKNVGKWEKKTRAIRYALRTWVYDPWSKRECRR